MPIYESSPAGGALRQGEILSNVVEARIDVRTLQGEGEPELEEKNHPLAVVMTQDCDLSWDYRARSQPDPEERTKLANKTLPNVLLCELGYADQLRGKRTIQSDLWRRIRANQDERYHILHPVPADCDTQGQGFPELAVDFKRVFTVRTEELYFRLATEAQRRSVLCGLFMQDLSTRFGYYQLRVPLPELPPSQPAPPQLAAALPPHPQEA